MISLETVSALLFCFVYVCIKSIVDIGGTIDPKVVRDLKKGWEPLAYTNEFKRGTSLSRRKKSNIVLAAEKSDSA